MTLARSLFCASAIGLAVSGAFANEYDYYAEERGASMSSVPPSVDESGTVRSPALEPVEVIIVEAHPVILEPQPVVTAPAVEPVSVNELFDRLDTNNDDRIGPQEAKADPGLDRIFEQADRNNSNALDRAELADAMAAPRDVSGVDALFARYDANRDGLISRQEAQADPELMRWFAQADRDRNNALTPGEFDDAVSIAAAEHRERARRG